MTPKTHPIAPALDAVEHLAHRAADRADDAIATTRHVANDTLDRLQSGVQDLQQKAPGVLARAAGQIDELSRRTAERARETTEHARERAAAAGEYAVGQVRDEPVKSLLIAAAAGAAAAALVGYLSRSRGPGRD